MTGRTFVAVRRAKFRGISGPVNIPRGTRLQESNGGVLVLDGRLVCTVNGARGRDFFALDDDGQGILRGSLTCAIRNKLQCRGKDYQARWNRIWGSLMCKRYQNPDHEDHWLWNQAFYEAPIQDLQSIARLVGARSKEAA